MLQQQNAPPAEASASEQGSAVNRADGETQANLERQIIQEDRKIREAERELSGAGMPDSEFGQKINEANRMAQQIYQDPQKGDFQRLKNIDETQTKVLEIQQDITINKVKTEPASEARWNHHIRH